MSLPIYQHINVRNENFEDVKKFFHKEMNLKHPVAINLKNIEFADQRKLIQFAEDFFQKNNVSFKFPYPIYFVTDHLRESSRLLLVGQVENLPRFFSQKESKLNVKETHLMGRNKLLQQEIINSDATHLEKDIQKYAHNHHKISLQEEERFFYKNILNKLMKVQKNG